MRGNNYRTMAEDARVRFLTYDQREMIDRWGLAHDQKALYLDFLTLSVRIGRRDGRLSFLPCGKEKEALRDRLSREDALTQEAMIIYDYLCYARERPYPAQSFASVSSLGGIIGAGHERGLKSDRQAAVFAGKTDLLDAACRLLGGKEAEPGDVSYLLPVLGEVRVWFQFYDEDEEFPASLKYLFDGNALKFFHYETLWYIMNCLNEALTAIIRSFT